MYMCQSCKGKFSNIGSNGLCIECCRKNRAVNIENEKMKQLIITNDFDYEIISSVTGKSIAEIEEFVKENEIKISKSLKLYRCSQCNRPTIHMYSKQGVTGLCRACAKEINQKLNFESGKNIRAPKDVPFNMKAAKVILGQEKINEIKTEFLEPIKQKHIDPTKKEIDNILEDVVPTAEVTEPVKKFKKPKK